MRAFALVDHCLSGAGGHPVRMAETFLEARAGNTAWGRKDCALGHPRLNRFFKTDFSSRVHRFPAKPSASAPKWKLVKHLLACLVVMARTNAKYFAEVSRIKCAPSTIWFAPNASLFTLPGLLLHASLDPHRRIVCYFQNPPSRHLRACGLLARLLRLSNVRFVSEEVTMCARTTEALRHKVHAALFPLLPPRWLSTPLTRRQSIGPLVMTVLGLPRREKGFHFIPDVAERLRGELASGKLILEVQVRSEDIELENLRLELSRLKAAAGVRFVEGALSPEDYLLKLRNCDAVFTPYLESAYSQRLSWISIEGLALGKPVLVTTNTLAADILRRYRTGLFFPDANVDAMATSVGRLLANYEHFQDQSLAAAPAFRDDNSAERFFACLEHLFES